MATRRTKGRVITAIIMMLTVAALLVLTSCGDKPFYKDAVVENIYNGSDRKSTRLNSSHSV